MVATTLDEQVEHGYADSDGVQIHYASLGSGPLVVLIHGFPDFWYSWRYQMPVLAAQGYQAVALDLRGYNLSDQPLGREHYAMRLLVGDVAAVIRHRGRAGATVVGHDWGGAIAWQFAMHVPAMTERLIVLNLPHPRGLARELATNEQQQRNSQYARDFQEEGAHEKITPEALVRWLPDTGARDKHLEALRRSSMEGMLNYYKVNYQRPPYQEPATPVVKVQAPVLLIHGLADRALLPAALNNTWEWVEQDLTIMTVPKVGHWVHHEAHDLVTRTIVGWLAR